MEASLEVSLAGSGVITGSRAVGAIFVVWWGVWMGVVWGSKFESRARWEGTKGAVNRDCASGSCGAPYRMLLT